ncbi:ankyrin repeat domain-containing protein [Bacillus sp. KH172YL63]|uniref:ankyrin repeat domain-containing protein n=1 Tax=Bacillus sp. KH172YL63 TaxID=2709784 RepID=UPI0013E476F5|nr:ankyrin repeat domain-containing protein [Bacillus sp. KH172YL63]BCB03461.1 hypothetical protein KH172YL63_15940 [Bacillus sp. KH172YL63]
MTNQAFFKAIETGDKVQVEQILRNDPNLCNAENEHGLTALGVAAHYGHLDVVELLLNFGADIHAVSRSKLTYIPSNTALHAGVAGKASKEVVEFLLKNGAKVNKTDSSGYTPLHIAAFDAGAEITSLLLTHGDGEGILSAGDQRSPLDIARERDNKEFIKAYEEFEKREAK